MSAPVAVVMVGGRGERLRPLTDTVPKPLLPVGGEPIVTRILKRLATAGVEDVWLTVNYLPDAFEAAIGDGSQLGLRVRYLHEQQPLGTAGSLALLPSAEVGGPVVVTNGDLVTGLDFAALLAFHTERGAALTVCGVQYETKVQYGVLRNEGSRLLGIDEKPAISNLVNAGMYVVDPELLALVPRGVASGMPDLIDRVLAEGRVVEIYEVLDGWIDIGSFDEYSRVTKNFAPPTAEESTS